MDEFDELEIETIAAGHLFEDVDCDETQIDEYGEYGIVEHHYHNSGCGCLTLVSTGFLLSAAILILVF